MTPDTSDLIARRLRQTRADMLGTADEDHYWDCHAAAQEIERLRLTDAEREAIELVAEAYSGKAADAYAHNEDDQHYSQIAATLRGLLERMSGTGDCPAQDNTATQDNSQFAKRESDSPQAIAECDATPPADSTADECSVPAEWTSKPYWVDPPSGWRYGFPRLYDPAADGDMTAWMIANGYPERLANQGLACTFTAQEEDGVPRSRAGSKP
jgi:hypothetical protein